MCVCVKGVQDSQGSGVRGQGSLLKVSYLHNSETGSPT